MKTRTDPDAESIYLRSARDRLHDALGPGLVGVYAGGSWALGDYLPGRSDLDLAVVVDRPVSKARAAAVVSRLRHESLPCPARLLELVAYLDETARSGSATADFELNVNTGARVPLAVQSRDSPGEVAHHWFPIDRSVLSQAGVALLGPPAAEVFAPIPRAELLPVVADSVAWQRRHGGSGDAVLNACRALRYANEGRWASKPAAGRWAAERALAPTGLVTQALQARTEGTALDLVGAASFLRSVEAHLRASVDLRGL